MSIQKSRQIHISVFEKFRTILLGIMIASIAVLFLASNMRTAEAAATNNWTCTGVFGFGQGQTESLATARAWKKWRDNATNQCGAKCALLKNAKNKVSRSQVEENGARVKVRARACYFLPGIGSMKNNSAAQHAPTKLR